MIDAADPEKLIFQKALLLAFDQKKTVIIKTKSYKGSKVHQSPLFLSPFFGQNRFFSVFRLSITTSQLLSSVASFFLVKIVFFLFIVFSSPITHHYPHLPLFYPFFSPNCFCTFVYGFCRLRLSHSFCLSVCVSLCERVYVCAGVCMRVCVCSEGKSAVARERSRRWKRQDGLINYGPE